LLQYQHLSLGHTSLNKGNISGGGLGMRTTFSSAAMNVPANAACASRGSCSSSAEAESQGGDVGETLRQHLLAKLDIKNSTLKLKFWQKCSPLFVCSETY
jgi:hypothetical protein